MSAPEAPPDASAVQPGATAVPPGAAAVQPRAAVERGRTTVSRQAVERIAARLAAGCPDVGGPDAGQTAARWPAPRTGRPPGDPVVAARLHSATAVSLAVRCSVRYPQPVARTAQALRELLMAGISELTGMRVQRVDISVTALPSGALGRRLE